MEVVVDGVIYETQRRGGISRVFNQILPRACHLDPDLRVTVRTLDLTRVQTPPVHPAIRHVSLPLLRPARVWSRVAPWAQRQARAGLPRRAIWHSTYYTDPPVWLGPRLVTAHDTIHLRYADVWSDPGADAFRRLQRRAILAADAVVCVSETTRRDVVDWFGVAADRLHVVHLSHDAVFRLHSPETGRLAAYGLDAPFVLYVGGRFLYKSFGTLLDAYARWSHRADLELVVVGEPWTTAEEAHLERLGIRSRARLLDDVDDDTLAALYSLADAFVYPSLYEGFGIPLLEAMACGCPLVASRIPTTEEVAGAVPFYFEPGDADGLADALDRAVAEGRDGTQVGCGVARAAQFSWERAAAETLSVYRSL